MYMLHALVMCSPRSVPPTPVVHDSIDVGGIETFFRQTGPTDAPVVLLPHGYPCSSFEFRNLMAALGDRWRLVAPDLPGFGYSATPDRSRFAYTFDAYADFLGRFAQALELPRYALYLHDYASQFGLRLALEAPDRVAALIIQNGDIYEDALGPKYARLRAFWANPTEFGRERLRANISLAGFRDEFLGDLPDYLARRVTPDLWALMNTPDCRANILTLFEDQATTLGWFEREQAYLREHRPPTLILWGPHDGYMPEAAGRAYLRDLPDAELHVLDAGHWALETNLDEIVPIARDFLGRVHASR